MSTQSNTTHFLTYKLINYRNIFTKPTLLIFFFFCCFGCSAFTSTFFSATSTGGSFSFLSSCLLLSRSTDFLSRDLSRSADFLSRDLLRSVDFLSLDLDLSRDLSRLWRFLCLWTGICNLVFVVALGINFNKNSIIETKINCLK